MVARQRAHWEEQEARQICRHPTKGNMIENRSITGLKRRCKAPFGQKCNLCSCQRQNKKEGDVEMSTDERIGWNTRFGHWAIVAWKRPFWGYKSYT
nr:hypothetical protein Iba_chr10aCG16180 [Ipomoea batatas]